MKARKRERGVFERPPGSGVWWILYYDHGQRHREKVGRKSAAIDAYRKRKTQVREGKFFPEQLRRQVTFAQLSDDIEKRGIDRVAKTRLAILRGWFGERSAGSITPVDIRAKLEELQEEGRSSATINRYRALLSVIFSWAIENGKAQHNPARKVRLLRENNARIRFLEPADEKKLRAAIRLLAPYGEAEIDLALHTGIRRGRQYGLKWDQVDLKRGYLTIGQKHGGIQHVPLNTSAKAALEKLRERGGPKVCPEDSREWFESARKSAGIDGFRWHDLRHTFASRLVMKGVDLRTVQVLMGHKTITMTLRYAHLAPSHERLAIEKIAVMPKRPTATKTATRDFAGRKNKARKAS